MHVGVHRISARCAKTVAEKSLRAHGGYVFLISVRGARDQGKQKAPKPKPSSSDGRTCKLVRQARLATIPVDGELVAHAYENSRSVSAGG